MGTAVPAPPPRPVSACLPPPPACTRTACRTESTPLLTATCLCTATGHKNSPQTVWAVPPPKLLPEGVPPCKAGTLRYAAACIGFHGLQRDSTTESPGEFVQRWTHPSGRTHASLEGTGVGMPPGPRRLL